MSSLLRFNIHNKLKLSVIQVDGKIIRKKENIMKIWKMAMMVSTVIIQFSKV